MHVLCVGLSLVVWMLKLSVLFLLSRSLKTDIPFWFVMSIGSVAVIVSLLPISISGLGTRDAVFIFFLSLHNISAESAVALSFLFLIFGFWSVVVSFALMHVNKLCGFLFKRT